MDWMSMNSDLGTIWDMHAIGQDNTFLCNHGLKNTTTDESPKTHALPQRGIHRSHSRQGCLGPNTILGCEYGKNFGTDGAKLGDDEWTGGEIVEEVGEGDDRRLDGGKTEDRETLGDDIYGALGWISVDQGMID